jgi:membrane fusion protein, multidrug efflux system
MESENVANSEGGQNALRKWGPVGLIAVAAAGIGIWIGGLKDEQQWPDEKGKAAAVAPASDEIKAVVTESVPEENLVRGVINPSSESTISSKMTARIVAMPYGEGQSFPAGALLARFDCSQIKAELNAAQAATAAYKKTYDTNVELDQYEAVGKNEVAVSKANLGKAQAEANAVATQLSDCEVHAPFAGKVVEQIAHAREVAASGQPLLKIQSGREVELELIVPSKWLTWLRPGAGFAFKIDETGNIIRGKVKRFGASVDPVSKTIRVTGIVTERNGLVLAGMSGTATFDDPRANGGEIAAPVITPDTGKADGKPS